MKVQIQQTPTQQLQFKGAMDSSLRYLATNQAIGANGVDFCFMVTPRTASDTIKRGPAAGLETFRREIMGTVNDSFIGLFGAAAGALIAMGINKKFGLNVNDIFTAPETLNILAENKADQLKNNKTQLDYIKSTLAEVKAYNPTSARADADGFSSRRHCDDTHPMCEWRDHHFETGYNSAKILFQRILYPGDERVIQRGEWICFPGGRARIL